MIRQNITAALAASALLLGTTSALAQVQGGTSGSVQGRDVAVSTYGTGTVTQNGVGVTGGAEAQAVDGTATTSAEAKFNERRAQQRSSATAETEEERARARTRTNANLKKDTVRSTTTTFYKADGERPVRETVRTVTTPEGTTTKTNGGKKPR